MTALEIPHLAAINSLPTSLLYPNQADGLSFLISKGRAILGDDMGLGKTRQAIVGMQIAAPTGMILVVSPPRSSSIGGERSGWWTPTPRSRCWVLQAASTLIPDG